MKQRGAGAKREAARSAAARNGNKDGDRNRNGSRKREPEREPERRSESLLRTGRSELQMQIGTGSGIGSKVVKRETGNGKWET